MMHQTIQNRRGGKPVGEQLIPSAHWQVGRDNEGVLFVTLADYLEEKTLSFSVHFYIGKFVYDQQGDLIQIIQHFPQRSFLHFFIQPVHQILCIDKKNPVTCTDRIEPDACCDHTLAYSRRTNNDNVLAGSNKVQPAQFCDLVFIQRLVKAVINVLKVSAGLKACFFAEFFCAAVTLTCFLSLQKTYKEGLVSHGRGFCFRDQIAVLSPHVYQFELFHHGVNVFCIRVICLPLHLRTSSMIFSS